MTINFEQDQQDAMKKTDNIQSLADQVEALEFVIRNIEGTRGGHQRKEKTNPTHIRRGYTYHDV